jgi:hypothetical protein
MEGAATMPDWTLVANGFEYRQFTLPDPNNVFVARMDRGNLSVSIESCIAQGRLVSGKETVSGMAARYDQTINSWGQTWGPRNNVVVAINGDFHDPTTGLPTSGQIHSGWYAKRFRNLESGSGFAWKLDRGVFVGQCVHHRNDKQLITFTATGVTQRFDDVNTDRGSDKLIVYTPQYDACTNTDDTGVEVLVEMTRPSLILPPPAMALGYVREIRDGQGSTPIPFDHVVLSATGTARTTLLGNVNTGDQIGISQELTHFESDCSTRLALDWTKAYAGIGGSFYFLKNGTIPAFTDPGATFRNPRTAIAFNDFFIFFVVVDGRDPANSVGMTIDELGQFARDTLGAMEAIAQDSGGSSTIVVNGEVKNNPSDGTERAVANGMMMVVVEPPEQSTAFAIGNTVWSASLTGVRLGPGTNYAILTTVPTNTQGTIQAHFNNLEGVLATGSYWWKVAFDGVVGWVPEEALTSQAPPAGFIVKSRAGGQNFGRYTDTRMDDSPLKSAAPGTTPGIGSREGSLRRTGPTRSATFQFVSDKTGTYEVFATWAASAQNHNVVEYLITHSGGTASLLVDQTSGQNVWNSLGQYTLIAGNTYTVEITNRNYATPPGSPQVFRADAVLWSLVAETPTGTIAGSVTNAEDGAGISGATVQVERTGQSGTTSANGAYQIPGVPARDHMLTASAAGFEGQSQLVTVAEDATTTADFALNPQTVTGVSVTGITPDTMQAGTTIDVTLIGAGFAPGASVSFESGQGPAPSASNVLVLDSNTVSATVTAGSGGPPRDRVWDIRATNLDGSTGVLSGGFTITP